MAALRATGRRVSSINLMAMIATDEIEQTGQLLLLSGLPGKCGAKCFIWLYGSGRNCGGLGNRAASSPAARLSAPATQAA